MPESRKRKKVDLSKNPQRRPNRAVPRNPLQVPASIKDRPDAERFTRDPAKPIPGELKYVPVELPEPASYDQVLVALADLDPLEQEVMLAHRLAAMPHPGDPENGMPVHIERMARAPWAHHLRKLGIFCVPELATHELIAPDRATGAMINHTAMSARKIDHDDLWRVAREKNPEMAKLVDEADTPEKKQAAMKKLAGGMPVEIRIAMQRLLSKSPADLEPS